MIDTYPHIPKLADPFAAKGLLSGDRGPCATAAPGTAANPRRLDTHALPAVLAYHLPNDADPWRVFARVSALQLRELQLRHGSWEFEGDAVAGGARVRPEVAALDAQERG